jgi:dihydrofolate reductase
MKPRNPTCITLIAAMARERIIGRNNRMPWHLPADLARFRRLTLGKPVIMGRRTWQSLPGPLPGRRMLVVSADPTFAAPQCEVAPSPAAALALSADAEEVMIIGGAMLYRAMLPLARRMELTLIDADIPGDTRFPDWDRTAWRELHRERRPRDGANAHDLEFVTLARIGAD